MQSQESSIQRKPDTLLFAHTFDSTKNILYNMYIFTNTKPKLKSMFNITVEATNIKIG